MNSILDISVSCFRNCNTPDGPCNVNLLSWLHSDKYADKVEKIRSIENKATRDELKKKLPAITPSGTFARREVAALIAHSGFIAFDLDNVEDIPQVKRNIMNIVNVAYVGLSVSGRGLWGLVPITHPERHLDHFKALQFDLSRYAPPLDTSCSDVSHLRIYSFDPDGYFNHSARPYSRLYQQRPEAPPRYQGPTDEGVTRDRVETIISRITLDMTGDYGREWFPIGAALANEFGEVGRGYFHAVSHHHPHYNTGETDRMFDYCLKGGYDKITIATFFHIAKAYGITYV